MWVGVPLCYALGRLAESFASFTGVASTGSVALVATWPSGARTSSGSESRVHLVHPPMRRSDCRKFLLAASSTLFSGHRKCHKTLPTTFMLSVMHVTRLRPPLETLTDPHVIAVPCHIMSCTLSCPAASALLVRCGVFLFLFDDAKILTTRSRQQFKQRQHDNYGFIVTVSCAQHWVRTLALTHRRQVYTTAPEKDEKCGAAPLRFLFIELLAQKRKTRLQPYLAPPHAVM